MINLKSHNIIITIANIIMFETIYNQNTLITSRTGILFSVSEWQLISNLWHCFQLNAHLISTAELKSTVKLLVYEMYSSMYWNILFCTLYKVHYLNKIINRFTNYYSAYNSQKNPMITVRLEMSPNFTYDEILSWFPADLYHLELSVAKLCQLGPTF